VYEKGWQGLPLLVFGAFVVFGWAANLATHRIYISTCNRHSVLGNYLSSHGGRPLGLIFSYLQRLTTFDVAGASISL